MHASPPALTWKDLSVDIEFEDPFEALSRDQLMDLATYVRCSNLQAQNKASEGMLAEQKEIGARLQKQGIDIDALLAQRERVRELRIKQATAVNDTLDGKVVRMPGYALALEYDANRKIQEFLLVPWVGACIHTPPPPPNQIVYVKAKKGFKTNSRFEPVWIEGTMQIKELSRELFLIDGSSNISVSYSMLDAHIEKYNEGPEAEVRPAQH